MEPIFVALLFYTIPAIFSVLYIIFILKKNSSQKKIIDVQDNTIKQLKKQHIVFGENLLEKDIRITKLSADNAVLKQKVINLESELNAKLSEAEKMMKIYKETGCMPLREPTNPFWAEPVSIVASSQENFLQGQTIFQHENKKTVHPNLQAYYDRGRNKKNEKLIAETADALKRKRAKKS